MGSTPLSIKGQAVWGGLSRLNTNDRGQRTFVKLENCYVSQDGQEIRQFPGYGTLVDLTEVNNSLGYSRYVPDAVRPVLEYNGSMSPYHAPHDYDASDTQTLWSRAKMSSLFGFEQIGNELFIVGESRYREDPIYDDNGDQVTVTEIKVSASGTTGAGFSIVCSGTLGGNTTTDSGGYGLNGLQAGDTIIVGQLTTADADDQAVLDANICNLIHKVNTVGVLGSDEIDIETYTTVAGGLSATTITATGEIHRIRPNREDDYPAGSSLTPANGPYTSIYDKRPDDPDALTVWRVTEPLDMLGTTYLNEYPCYPAWVANRQRDFGDNNDTYSVEGLLLWGDPSSPVRGASRREQRRLPYRPCIEPALDRLILAAPGYGCMFQVPAIVPIDPSSWQAPVQSDIGIPTAWNGIYDKPRSLGIPKARLVESFTTPSSTALGVIGSASVLYSANIAVYESPNGGTGALPAGQYKMAISWEDPGTGEEGLASEPVYVDIVSTDDMSYTIQIVYIHPGYHMPETMGLRMNVYLSAKGSEAMGFYGSFEMENITTSDAGDLSARYGLGITETDDPFAIIRRFDLPLPNDTGDIDDLIDPTRLAPQSNSMPRGAEACKYVRGVLFSGGALGNAGPNGQLWRGKASSTRTNSSDFWADDELFIQAHSGTDAAVPSSGALDGDSQNGTLGIAGRAFPDAYQGIEFVEDELLPGSTVFGQVDKVMNRRVLSAYRLEFPTTNGIYPHHERLKLLRTYGDRVRQAGDANPTTYSIGATSKDIYYLMPRGQLQIGDPGRPDVASKAFIKVTDPRRGDDIKAIGQLGGSTIVCSQRETYSYSWYRNPAGEEPNLMSEEFGCIGNNTMVEFDGGLAWLSHRGPVALGQGLQHVGRPVAEYFYDTDRRYYQDSTGMMRHSWGVHDAQRGLVMWGLVTRTGTQSIPWEGSTVGVAAATDEQLSRMPCDEVLIWSYRANAWSTWRPPSGLEIYWMRPLRDAKGITRMCFLAADGRIYALDDEWSDSNGVFNATLSTLAVTGGTASTTLTLTNLISFKDGDTSAGVKKNLAMYLRAGMLVEFLDQYGNVTAETTIASVTTSSQSGNSVIELSAAQTWSAQQTVRIGGRQRATITSTYVGAETMDTMQVQGVTLRYALEGVGHANARVKMFKAEQGVGEGEEAKSVTFTTDGQWDAMGFQKAGTTVPAEIDRLGRRINFKRGQISGPELAVQVELTGEAQVRIQDIILEVG